MKLITSVQNPLVKSYGELRYAKERKKTGSFLVEGAREIAKALAAEYELITCLVCPALLSPLGAEIFAQVRLKYTDAKCIELDAKCFSALAMREDKDGILVILKARSHELHSLKLGENSLLLAVENVEKPGNLGAILRSADGAGVSGVVVLSSTGKGDLYHPHIVRSSLGTVFSLPIVVCRNEEFSAWCKQNSIAIYAASLSESAVQYFTGDYRRSCSIVVGSEAWGLSAYWQEHCSAQVYIPMLGAADSLNVSVASGILLYEARRQRLVS